MAGKKTKKPAMMPGMPMPGMVPMPGMGAMRGPVKPPKKKGKGK